MYFWTVKIANIIFISILLFLTGVAEAREADSLVLNRMFKYQHIYRSNAIDTFSTNCYTRYFFDTQRRNFTLWLIPNMYSFARGERQNVSEQFGSVKFENFENIKVKNSLFFTTVPHNGKPLSVLKEFSVPQLYSTTLYGNHILSPFNSDNRIYYRYKVVKRNVKQAVIEFKPLLGNNTQLVSGQATVLLSTGRIIDASIYGEYDMINFHTMFNQGGEKKNSKKMLPITCKTDIDFKFLGNHITSSFVSVYNLPDLPKSKDSLLSDRRRLDKIRPIRLTKGEKRVLERYDSIHSSKQDTTVKDTTTAVFTLSTLKNIGLDVGSYLLRSHSAGNDNFSFNLSPIVQPQYISYSPSRGFSYKMMLWAEYNLGSNSNLRLTPTLGYNFKIDYFYYQLPLRYTYDKAKDNYLELRWNNGNRIANSSVLETIEGEIDELPEKDKYNLTEFDDNQLSLMNSIQLTRWLRFEGGLMYRYRYAVNKDYMRKYDLPETYRSLGPNISLIMQPFQDGPTLSVNTEHALKLKAFQMSYDRWEAGLSQIIRLPRTQLLNIHVGGGFYTSRSNNYFMTYANFTENYLSGGWDDDWSGEFHLLDSRLYNLSRYYINSNISFDSPLMMTSFFPYIGHYIERERFYWNGLLIEHSRPYWELGYGFTTRFFSAALFGSFLDFGFQEIGAKFTIELFRRW